MKFDTMTVTTNRAAEILGVMPVTLRAWRARHGLLPELSSVTGRSVWTFARLLRAGLAARLMSLGVSGDNAARVANHADALGAFIRGERVTFGLGDGGEVRLHYGPADVVMAVPMEGIGFDIAGQLLADIRARLGEGDALLAAAELEVIRAKASRAE